MRQMLGGVSVMLLSACAPMATSEAQLPAASSRETWVLIVHGSGDGPDRWANGMAETLRTRLAQPERVEVVAYDWKDAALDKLAAAGNGQREGEAIAGVIAERGLAHVHVIAHSAGAHVAYGLETALGKRAERPTVHVTLLDPFLGMGLDFEWGKGRFGKGVDFVDQWFNVGDGVPGTDVAVSAAHAFDVSGARPAEVTGKDGHWWPTRAYLELEPGLGLAAEVSGRFDVEALRAAWPAGAVTRL